MHRQMTEVHMGYHTQQQYQDYSPPSVACPISIPYDVYASTTSNGIPYPQQASLHVISQGNTPPPQQQTIYAAPQMHPLAGAAPMNYQTLQGGAAAPTGQNGYQIAQAGTVPSSSGGFPESGMEIDDEVNAITAFNNVLTKGVSIDTSTLFLQMVSYFYEFIFA